MLQVTIVTPERSVFSGMAREVVLPTLDGIIGVRPGHQPLVAPLKAGEVVVKGNETSHIAVAGGFAEIAVDGIRILADSADRAEELNEAAIAEAIERAERLKQEAGDVFAVAEATAVLELNRARLKVAKRKRSYGSRSEAPESS